MQAININASASQSGTEDVFTCCWGNLSTLLMVSLYMQQPQAHCYGVCTQDNLQERKSKEAMTAQTGQMQQASLLQTILRVLGWPYAALGLLKLLNDILNFAGLFSDLLACHNNHSKHNVGC